MFIVHDGIEVDVRNLKQLVNNQVQREMNAFMVSHLLAYLFTRAQLHSLLLHSSGLPA